MPVPEPAVLVVFGATGDLMARKIVPALFHLHGDGLLPARFRVVGFSRRDWSDETLREHVANVLGEHRDGCPACPREDLGDFLGMFAYQRGTFEDAGAYRAVAARLEAVDAEWGECGDKLFYLAVPPEHYRGILTRLAESGLARECGEGRGWTRVLVEKPFGRDFDSAQALDELLGRLFREEQIYRIDHYLAKDMLQGILAFRFANNLLEPSWNNEAVEKVEISLLETVGAEGRGGFYDATGALRDVGQNHLLQMLALVTMRRPGAAGAASIRARRAEVLRSLAVSAEEDVPRLAYRAQYRGYRGIEGVAPDSRTETFFRLRASLRLPEWRGVPILMQAGKRLGSVRKEIVVTFKHPEPCLRDDGHRANRVVFSLEPERILIRFYAKKPGLTDELEARDLTFVLHEADVSRPYVEEYATLLDDAVQGDQSLFVSTEEVRAMWGFIDPFVHAWERDRETPMDVYGPGTDEPLERSRRVDVAPALPMPEPGEVGIVGLGRMGSAMVLRMMERGWRVVGYNRSPGKTRALEAEGVAGAYSLPELVAALTPPRVVWLMLPAGTAFDEIVLAEEGLAGMLSPGDLVVDGGNSFYEDSADRAALLEALGLRFVDCGVSGGPEGARTGACLMVGGRREDFERLERLFADFAAPDAYRFFEGAGAGHFVKMVHNGIEYGMMQAIAEGFDILRRSSYELDLAHAADVYSRGSVIESRLVSWLSEAFRIHGPALEDVTGRVGATGEGAWTVETARAFGAEARVIADAVRFRELSQRSPGYAGKVVSAMRERFGGHAVSEPLAPSAGGR